MWDHRGKSWSEDKREKEVIWEINCDGIEIVLTLYNPLGMKQCILLKTEVFLT